MPSPVFAQELEWHRLAFGGAKTYALAVAEEGEILYLATELGLEVSEDGGETWLYGGQGLDEANAPQVQALAVSPSDSRVVYAGTVPGNGAGLYRSLDTGRTWNRIWSGRRDDGIRAVEVSPDDPQRIVAIAVAHEGKDDEVIGSEDGGESWDILLGEAGWQSQKLYDLASEPGDATIAYAAGTQGVTTFREGQRSWSRLPRAAGGASSILTVAGYPGILVATGQRDVYLSDNHGASWSQIPGPGLGVCEAFGRDGLALFGLPHPVLLASTYSLCPGHDGHIYALGPSADSGDLWRQIDAGLPLSGSYQVVAVGDDGPIAFALTSDGLWTADLAPLLASATQATATPTVASSGAAAQIDQSEGQANGDFPPVAIPPLPPTESAGATSGPGVPVVVAGIAASATLGIVMVAVRRRLRQR